MRVYKTAAVSLLVLAHGVGVHAFSAQLAKRRYATLHESNRFGSTTNKGRESIKETTREQGHDSSSTELDASSKESEVAEVDNEQEDVKKETDAARDSLDAPHVFVTSTSGVAGVVAEPLGETPTSPTSDTTMTPTVLSCWKDLLGMTRPSNFMGVVIFHLLGTYLAAAASNAGDLSFVSTLLKPSMCVVLMVLLLTSATSMLVNDYYDARLGVDAEKARNKPLISGDVPFAVAKQALNYMYAATLLGTALIPGVPARLSVVVGLMLTFWYTKHLKPITWLKNVVCASLIAFAPLTSGSAAIAVQRGAGATPSAIDQMTSLPLSLVRLVSMLFFGFLGREIMMDINDTEDDRLHRVRTVPVKYGRRFASGVALASTAIMSSLVLFGPILGGNNRRLVFALLGVGAMMWRVVNVVRTEGRDKDIVDRAIEEGHLTMMFLLASFI